MWAICPSSRRSTPVSYTHLDVYKRQVEASIRKAIRQIEAGRRLAELAPVEPEPEADPESEDVYKRQYYHVPGR